MYESELEVRQICPRTKKPSKNCCVKCKTTFYFSREDQVHDWKSDDHYDEKFMRFLEEGKEAARKHGVDRGLDGQDGKHKTVCGRLNLARIDRIWLFLWGVVVVFGFVFHEKKYFFYKRSSNSR